MKERLSLEEVLQFRAQFLKVGNVFYPKLSFWKPWAVIAKQT